jgi:acetyl esterase/lipase
MSVKTRVLSWLLVKAANRSRGEVTVAQLRRFLGPPDPSLDEVRGVTFSRTSLGSVPAERVLGDEPPRGDALFIHGGAYVAGTSGHFRKLFSPLARDLALRGWSIDYRLAPEHPFPAAVDDGLEAYRALVEGGAEPARTIVCGESAGGNIALSTLLSARDRGLPMPAALLLFWPQTDLTLSGESLEYNRGRDFLTMSLIESSARMYLGGADQRDPRASPLFANLEGMPPTLVQVGERDMIRSDGERLVSALEGAGVVARLEVWPRAVHGFAAAGDDQPESRQALAGATTWLRDQLATAAR